MKAVAAKVFTARLAVIEMRHVVRRDEGDQRITAAQGADIRAVFAQALSTRAVLELTDEVARHAAGVS